MPDSPALLSSTATRWFKRARGWTLRNTYSWRAQRWLQGSVVLAVTAAVAAAFGEWLLTIVLAACAHLGWSSWRRWRCLIDGEPMIVLAAFESENPPYDAIATTHVRQLERRLRGNALLGELISVRVIPTPLSEKQVANVMRFAPVLAVVTGAGLAVDGSVRWEGWMRVIWVSTVGRFKSDDTVQDEELHEAVERLPLPVDGEHAMSSLTASRFDASHARVLEIAALLAAGALWRRTDDVLPTMPDQAAELPPELAARLLVARERHRSFGAGGDALRSARKLENLAATYNFAHVWEAAMSLGLAAAQTGSVHRRQEAIRGVTRCARGAIHVDPENLMALCNLAFQALAEEDRSTARGLFRSAIDIAHPSSPGNIYPDLVAHAFFAGGDANDWLRWRANFEAALDEDKPAILNGVEITDKTAGNTEPPARFGHP